MDDVMRDRTPFYSELQNENYFRLILHELRNPLNSIMGGVNLLNMETAIEKDYSIKLIDYGVNQLLHVIDVMAEFAHLENREKEISLDLVDDLESFINKIEGDINQFTDIAEKPKFVLLHTIINTKQLILNKRVLCKVLKIILFNIVYGTNINEISIHFSTVNNSKYIIKLEGTKRGIPIDKIPYIYNHFNKPDTITNQRYLSEPRYIYHVFLNKLLILANAEIEVITKSAQGVSFNICFPCLS